MSARLLSGTRALVTGGTRGIGLAVCQELAQRGARVAFSYLRNKDAAERTREAVSAAGAEGRGYQVSVLDTPGTEAMVADLEKAWGGIDVLVNNAGVTQNLPLALLEEEDFDHVMDINVKGTFLTSKAVLRGMIRRKAGVILNIGSLAGVRMMEAPIHYCASKAALTGLTSALAKEVARHGVRVLCLAPGLLDDGMGKTLPDYRLRDYLHHCSLGRLGSCQEVARFVAFLVSQQNTYMNGSTVVMDGGV